MSTRVRRYWERSPSPQNDSSENENKAPSLKDWLPSNDKKSDDQGFLSGTMGDKLAQEIHDEFLVCKICLEPYKTPKCLACLHTFCENCIENHVMAETTYKKYSDYREFTCPLCRKRTQLPIGGVKKLADNFLVSSLTELVDRQKPNKFPFCDICKQVSKRHREAASKCLDCNKLLCKQCVDIHRETKVTKNHSIFDVDIQNDIQCKEHADEVVRFFCEPCETCICVLCTFNEHRDHEITQFQDAVSKYKVSIEEMLDSCKGKIEQLEDQLEKIAICEASKKEAEQMIHDSAIQFISEIRNREKMLIEELNNMYGQQAIQLIEHRGEMKSNLDGLVSTCHLTEVVLKGKDMELLLLKKQVKDKLSGLAELDVIELPNTITKQVKFMVGTLDLGYIHDMDRPLLSKLRAKKAIATGSYNDVDDEELLGDTEVQTDPVLSTCENPDVETMTDEVEVEDQAVQAGNDTRAREETGDNDSDVEENIEAWWATIERAVQTEQKSTDEKASNTRARGNSYSSLDTALASTTVSDDQPTAESPTDLGGANYIPNIARRRRRRDRVRTSLIAGDDAPSPLFDTHGYGASGGYGDTSYDPSYSPPLPRRSSYTSSNRRSLLYTGSVDEY